MFSLKNVVFKLTHIACISTKQYIRSITGPRSRNIKFFGVSAAAVLRRQSGEIRGAEDSEQSSESIQLFCTFWKTVFFVFVLYFCIHISCISPVRVDLAVVFVRWRNCQRTFQVIADYTLFYLSVQIIFTILHGFVIMYHMLQLSTSFHFYTTIRNHLKLFI